MTSIMSDSRTHCSIAVEDNFGPIVAGSCLGGFDFTLLFEEAILAILPLGIASELLLPSKIRLLFAELCVRYMVSASNPGSAPADVEGSAIMASATKNGVLFRMALFCIELKLSCTALS